MKKFLVPLAIVMLLVGFAIASDVAVINTGQNAGQVQLMNVKGFEQTADMPGAVAVIDAICVDNNSTISIATAAPVWDKATAGAEYNLIAPVETDVGRGNYEETFVALLANPFNETKANSDYDLAARAAPIFSLNNATWITGGQKNHFRVSGTGTNGASGFLRSSRGSPGLTNLLFAAVGEAQYIS